MKATEDNAAQRRANREGAAYRALLQRLGITWADAANICGIQERTARRYASKSNPHGVPMPVIKLLALAASGIATIDQIAAANGVLRKRADP